MATFASSSAAFRRMRKTTSRTQSCLEWLILSRKTLAPASISCPSMSEVSVAGPIVQMILVARGREGVFMVFVSTPNVSYGEFK